ncbi:type II toxin-antitoxin system RelE family toxin [Pseudolactococcus yaeyamensis]
MAYKFVPSPKFNRQFRKLDKFTQKRIQSYINNVILKADDPHDHGTQLIGNLVGLWRYRIGDYRLVVVIQDKELIILAVQISHRREVYR